MAEIMNAGTKSPMTPVTVDRPEAGETLTVLTASGLRIILAFSPDDARFSVEGDDFVLTFEDGARIGFQGLVTAAQGADAPTIQIAGIDIDAGVLMGQIQALAEQAQEEPIETAAGAEGEGAAGGGGLGDPRRDRRAEDPQAEEGLLLPRLPGAPPDGREGADGGDPGGLHPGRLDPLGR